MLATPVSILIGSDFSESAKLALDYALDGQPGRDHAEPLHVVSVIDDGGHHLLPANDRHATLMQTVDRVRELLRAEVAEAVKRYEARVGAPLVASPILHVRLGGVAQQIAALATEIHAALVIVGTHGRRGARRFILGSVSERTVRLAPCPVLVVRPIDVRAIEDLPTIEPACPACLKEREVSKGEHWWCEAHANAPEPAHTYSYSGRLTDPIVPRHHLL